MFPNDCKITVVSRINVTVSLGDLSVPAFTRFIRTALFHDQKITVTRKIETTALSLENPSVPAFIQLISVSISISRMLAAPRTAMKASADKDRSIRSRSVRNCLIESRLLSPRISRTTWRPLERKGSCEIRLC